MKRLMRLLGVPQPDSSLPRVRVGVCAMDKKAKSKPMMHIIHRLLSYGEFEIVPFGDEMILNQPIEEWPACDCLISWFSDGFPLKKAQAYVALRPQMANINDLNMQDILMDRRLVYALLKANKIPVPTHIIVNRENLEPGQDPEGFLEDDDYVELNGQRINKPFVEKPCDGENHNVHIYYPASMGGGVKRLFRKVDDKSSEYDPKHNGKCRRDGSYIIEEFLTTGGTDVKVYTVGPRYAHAEARKSPVVDGKVMRTADGKEMRFPVLLSPQEKEIACMVVNAFKQKICGFDLLRSSSGGRSYVCDVNGWSFVKNSKRYYDDCASILRSLILGLVDPRRLEAKPIPDLVTLQCGSSFSYNASCGMADDDALLQQEEEEEEEEEDVPGLDVKEAEHTEQRSQTEELRCVLAVIRHGDRTPKQKLKVKVTATPLLALFNKYKDSKGKQAKLKKPDQLQDLLDTVCRILEGMDNKEPCKNDGKSTDEMDAESEFREKLCIIKTVLKQAAFSGVNRKVQLKPLRWSGPPSGIKTPIQEDYNSDNDALYSSLPRGSNKGPLLRMEDLHGGTTSSGGGSTTDAPAPDPLKPVLEEALLIMKWGGVLTHAGRQQAEDLGKVFRMVMYPRYGSAGGGLLRLHSTYRHDLKIYSSDEGRVQASAAAFTKGLLDLEGTSLTPILVSLVNKDATMLEAFGKGASEDIRAAKGMVYAAMTKEADQDDEATQAKQPGSAAAAFQGPGLNKTESIDCDANQVQDNQPGRMSSAPTIAIPSTIPWLPENPLQLLHALNKLLKELVQGLRQLCLKTKDSSVRYSSVSDEPAAWKQEPEQPCSGEQMLLMFDRWNKLAKSFYNEKKNCFDISKVPDIYDSAKYDALHNQHLLQPDVRVLRELYTVAKSLADCVIPCEYGAHTTGKLNIGSTICGELLGKLLMDMAAMRDESAVVSTQPTTPRGPEAPRTAFQGSSDDLSASARALLQNVPGSKAPCESCQNAPSSETDTGTQGPEAHDEHHHDSEKETINRLDPEAATQINSPLRHVRTRIYFTSESHIHSLVNVLRFGHLHPANNPHTDRDDGAEIQEQHSPLLSEAGLQLLDNTKELDYLTHIVFRMYENKSVPVDAPDRFRVEILFSPGANHNPFEASTIMKNHALPPVARVPVHGQERNGGITLMDLETVLGAMAKSGKYKNSLTMSTLQTPGMSGYTSRNSELVEAHKPSFELLGQTLGSSKPPSRLRGKWPLESATLA